MRRSLVFVLAAGLSSWTWSEQAFWARFRDGDSAFEWIVTWLAYTAATYLALVALRRHRVHDWRGLFLVGATSGYLIEGCFGGTLYADLPVTLVWTSLAQHALVTVLVGWWWYPAQLRRGGRRVVPISLGLGAAWGFWSIEWWGAHSEFWDKPSVSPDLGGYALFVALSTALAALAYVVQHLSGPPREVATSTKVPYMVGGLVVVWCALILVPAVPWAPVLLAIVLAVPLWGLRRLPGRSPDLLEAGCFGVAARQVAPMMLIPVAATAVYAAAIPADGSWLPLVPRVGVPAVTCVIGLVWYVRSLRAARTAAVGA